jgi:hypothetical protein
MVRPTGFGFNPETASSNTFQGMPDDSAEARKRALLEFEHVVLKLNDAGIDVIVVDPFDAEAPDAVFPNNWFSTHEDGSIVYYPMQAKVRRSERSDSLSVLLRRNGLAVRRVIDLSPLETKGGFLEGTGSLVLDRQANIAYAAISERTDPITFPTFEKRTGYKVVAFHTASSGSLPVYHTNVMMSIGTRVALICADVIRSEEERDRLMEYLDRTMKTIIPITEVQMNAFCGNVLELLDRDGGRHFVMSETARKAFRSDQLNAMKAEGNILACSIPTIEHVGGGSVRCMMAEVFLPKQKYYE